MNLTFINAGGPAWQLFSMLIILAPVAMILIKQKGNNIYFQFLAAANILILIAACSMNKFISLPVGAMTFLQGLASLMHAPLGLAFLLYFTSKTKERIAIRNSLIITLVITGLALCFGHYSNQLVLNLMLIGSLIAFVFSSSLFIQYTINGVYENKDGDKAFLLSTIVFTYGTYFLLLLLNLISPEKHANDLQSLFAWINLLSSGFVAIGIGLMYQPKKETVEEVACKPKKLDAGFAQWDNFNFY
jgi:hypothetical protein